MEKPGGAPGPHSRVYIAFSTGVAVAQRAMPRPSDIVAIAAARSCHEDNYTQIRIAYANAASLPYACDQSFASLAQLVEQRPYKAIVGSSNLSGRTRIRSVNSAARVPACLAGSQGFESPTGRQSSTIEMPT